MEFSWHQYGGEIAEKSSSLDAESVIVAVCVGVVAGVIMSMWRGSC